MVKLKGVSDSVDFGSGANRETHRLTATSGVNVETIHTENGTVKKSYEALRFSKINSEADFYMNFSSPKSLSPESPFMLEIMEVHDNNYRAFGYQISINDHEVYFRTYEEIASGTIHYFVPFSRSLATNPNKVKISLISMDDSAFNIGKIWGYCDFYSLADQEEIFTKMNVNLYCNENIVKADGFMKTFSGYDNFDSGALYGCDYMNKTVEDSITSISSFISAAASTGSKEQIMLARSWSYTPYGPDGKGGIWSDLKYQQALYNPETKEFTNTTPNMWSDTCWESMTNSYLVDSAERKITAIIQPVADMMALLAAHGKSPEMLEIIMEWGTGYYYQTEFYGGDFSPENIENAKKQGINLDPGDGLSFEEKMFLYKIIAEVNQKTAEAYRRTIGYNPVVVQNGDIRLPDFHVIDHIYSHGTQTSAQYISYDDRITGWMSGIGTGYWPSSENMYWDSQRFYEYQMGYGRIACVNMEMYIYNPKLIFQNYIKRCYQNGMEYVTLFNDLPEYHSDSNLREIDQLQDEECIPPEHYERCIFDIDYMRDFSPDMITEKTGGVVEYVNCKIGNAGILFCSDISKIGMATYKIDDNGKEYENGFKLIIEGFTEGGASIDIFGGESYENIQKISRFEYESKINWFNMHSKFVLDLTSEVKGLKKYYIQIRLSPNGTEGSSVSLRAVKAFIPWAEHTGSKENISTTFKQARLQSRWVQQRMVTERMMNDYLEKSGSIDRIYDMAGRMYDQGRYKSACRLLTNEISQLLPAKYAILTKGRLERYPVEITLDDGNCIVMQIDKINMEEMRFSIITEKEQDITLKFLSLKKGDSYSMEQMSHNTYRIYKTGKDEQNSITVANNSVSFIFPASPEIPDRLASTVVSGRAFHDCQGRNIDVQVPDAKVSMYAQFNKIGISDTCRFTRKKEGDGISVNELPVKGDMVTVTLDDEGLATVIEAIYGEVTGTVKSFVPPSVTGIVTNGVIELDNDIKYEIEYNRTTTEFKTGNLDGLAIAHSLTEIGHAIKSGDVITISYCPYTYKGSYRRIMKISG
ncbi:MAG: hypothetical protein ACYCYI_03730 [Saccharofermentanales bacterium]